MNYKLSFWKIVLLRLKLYLINVLGRVCEFMGVIINPLTWDDILSKFDKEDQIDANTDDILNNQKKIINEIRVIKSKSPVRFREGIKYNTRRIIKQRLLMSNIIIKDPSILKVELVKPVFIIGLPKSGSTLLHNLFGLNEKFRVALAYELRNYSEINRLPKDKDPICMELDKLISYYKSCISSNYASFKNMKADKPEECHVIFEHLGLIFEYVYALSPKDMLSYRKFLKATINDKPYQHDIYNNFKQIIQMILRNDYDRTKRFVSSTPIHLFYLQVLIKIFPNAQFIFLHRNIYHSILSFCSELEILLKEDWMISCDHIGRNVLELFLDYSKIGLKNRRLLEEQGYANIFIDVYYDKLIDYENLNTLTNIFQRLGVELENRDKEIMKDCIREHEQLNQDIPISSSFEKYGLTYSKVTQELSDYINFAGKLG